MDRKLNIFTIGFTKTTAENFFNRLNASEVKRVIDVRLNNTSQLSGFAKGKDIAYFLKAIGEIDYLHEPLLAPTDEILTAFKKKKGMWSVYERQFLDLMEKRKIDERHRNGQARGPEEGHRKLSEILGPDLGIQSGFRLSQSM